MGLDADPPAAGLPIVADLAAADEPVRAERRRVAGERAREWLGPGLAGPGAADMAPDVEAGPVVIGRRDGRRLVDRPVVHVGRRGRHNAARERCDREACEKNFVHRGIASVPAGWSPYRTDVVGPPTPDSPVNIHPCSSKTNGAPRKCHEIKRFSVSPYRHLNVKEPRRSAGAL